MSQTNEDVAGEPTLGSAWHSAVASNSANPPSPDFFAGGGEMGALMRVTDWSNTALGPVDDWSPTLRMMVSFLLANRFPLLLWWGPEYVQLYNDPYRPVLGVKHPRSMGQPARECWPEIWHIIGPLIDTPYSGGAATWMEDIFLEPDRHGFVEETHFTIAYSPVPDASAPRGIGGVLATVHEITEQVVGERRVRVLRDLGTRSLTESQTAEAACATAAEILDRHARDVPFALFYLIDADGHAAKLAGAAGVQPGQSISPRVVDLTASAARDDGWPIGRAVETEAIQVVERIGSRFAHVPPGPWSDAPHTAVVLPIPSSLAHHVAGVLVAGVSPRLALDDSYRGFLDLLTAQVATAIANARAYEEEKRRAEALAELDRVKTQFFSNVSHEFRTPLTLMLGPLGEVLGRPNDLTDGAREELTVAQRNALRLLKLVNTLLDFSRIEAGRVDAAYEPTDLAAYTADLASSFRSAIERAGLRLVVDAPPVGALVHVDREMWEKIVLNLISNAFKHTFEGEITVSVRRRNGEVTVAVRDTGVGVPAEQLPRIFERFHRVPNARARTHEGTGIGLALVQELVRLHGGRIDVASEDGAGTTFTVHLPIGTGHLPREQVGARSTARERVSTTLGAAPFVEEALRWLPDGDRNGTIVPEQRERSSATASAGAASLAGLGSRILVADDNADMREYVGRLLRADGWHVESAPDGAAALASARLRPPDLVLADVMMPGLDGFELLKELRRDPITSGVPVVLLSARAGEESRIGGLAAGADDYLVKPFSAHELIARVGAHVRLARVRRESEAQFRAMFNNAPLGVYLVDADFRIAAVNPTALPVFGDIPGLIGRDFDEVMHILWPKAYADELVERFRHTLETGEPYSVPERIEERLDRGVREYYEWKINRLPLPEGRFGVVCYFRDISVQVRAHEMIEAAREAAEVANQAKSEFLAAMSHELRTPLNAIAGYVQLLEMGIHGPVTDAQRQALGKVRRSEEHLVSLITDVLNFAKIEAGKVEYRIEPVRLARVVADLGPLIEPQLAAKGLTYESRVDATVVALADRDRLQQILLNLLSNAIKFTGRGGRVTVDCPWRHDAPDGAVFLRVADTGIGIPREKQEAIFDPFVQVHRNLARTVEGTGLGLAISLDLARGMGGDLRVRSDAGQGAAFTVVLEAAR